MPTISLQDFIVSYQVAVVSFFACWGLYLLSDVLMRFPAYKKLKYGDKAEWNSRVVSSVHAIFVTYGAVVCLLTEKVLWDEPFTGFSLKTDWYMKVMYGYILYDFLLVLYVKQLRTSSTLFHHILVLVVYFVSMEAHVAQVFSTLWAFTEITTPLINNRWFLSTAKKTNSLFYILNGLGMTLGFVVFRVIAVPAFATRAFVTHWDQVDDISPYLLYTLLFCTISVTLLNVYWTTLLVRGLLKHLTKQKTPAKIVSPKQVKPKKDGADNVKSEDSVKSEINNAKKNSKLSEIREKEKEKENVVKRAKRQA